MVDEVLQRKVAICFIDNVEFGVMKLYLISHIDNTTVLVCDENEVSTMDRNRRCTRF